MFQGYAFLFPPVKQSWQAVRSSKDHSFMDHKLRYGHAEEDKISGEDVTSLCANLIEAENQLLIFDNGDRSSRLSVPQ